MNRLESLAAAPRITLGFWALTATILYLVGGHDLSAQWEEPCVEPFCPGDVCDDPFSKEAARERWYKNTDCERQKELEVRLAHFVPNSPPTAIECGNKPTKTCRVIQSEAESSYFQLREEAIVSMMQKCELAAIDLECGTAVFEELERIALHQQSEEAKTTRMQTF